MYQAWQWPTAAAGTNAGYAQASSVPAVPTVAGANSTSAPAIASTGTWPAYGQYSIPSMQQQWAWAAMGLGSNYASNMGAGQSVAQNAAYTSTSGWSGSSSDANQVPPPLPGDKPTLSSSEVASKSGQISKTGSASSKQQDDGEDEKLKQLQAQAQQWTSQQQQQQQQQSSWNVPATAAAAMSGSLTTAAMSMPPPTQAAAQWPQAAWSQNTWTSGQWPQQGQLQQQQLNWMQQSSTYKTNEVPSMSSEVQAEPDLKADSPKVDKAKTEAASVLAKEQSDAIAELDKEEQEFDHQFQEWEKQFESWKEQNKNHPDKEAFSNYERQWQEWREQLLKKKEQMRKKREDHLAELKKASESGSITSEASSLNPNCVTSGMNAATSQGIPGLDFQEEKSQTGVTISASAIASSATVAATAMPVPTETIASSFTSSTTSGFAANTVAPPTMSEQSTFFQQPFTTQPQMPVPPQPYMYMPPQPFVYAPNMPPPPPPNMIQHPPPPFQNTQVPPPPIVSQNNFPPLPKLQDELPPAKRPLLSTPPTGGGALLPSPGSRFSSQNMDYNQEGPEEVMDSFGNPPYPEDPYQDDWAYNDPNREMNYSRGRGRGRGHVRGRGSGPWGPEGGDYDRPRFIDNMESMRFEGSMPPSGCEPGFEEVNSAHEYDDENMNPRRHFKPDMNIPRPFEGNQPRGFDGGMKPQRGFGDHRDLSMGFEGRTKPRNFDAGMNPSRVFEENDDLVFEGGMNHPREFEGMNPSRGFEGGMNSTRNLDNPPRGFEGPNMSGFDGKGPRNRKILKNFDRGPPPFEGLGPRDFPGNLDGPRNQRDFHNRSNKRVDPDVFNPDACLMSTKFPPDGPSDEKGMGDDFTSDPIDEGQFPPMGNEQFGVDGRVIPPGPPMGNDRFPMDSPFGPRNQYPFDQPFEEDFPPFDDRRPFPSKPFHDMEPLPPRMRGERFPPEPFLEPDMRMGPGRDHPFRPNFPPDDKPYPFDFPDDRLPPHPFGRPDIPPFRDPDFGPEVRPPRMHRDSHFMDELHSNCVDYTHRPASFVMGDDFHFKYDAFDQQFGSDLINYRDNYYMGHIPPPPPPIIFSQVDVEGFDYNHGLKPLVTSTIPGKKSSKDSKSPFSNKVFDYAHRRDRSPFKDRNANARNMDRPDRNADRSRDFDRDKDRSRDRDRDRDKDRDRNRDRDRGDRDRDRDRHRERDREERREREDRREKEREEKKDRDDRDRDRPKERSREGNDKRSRWENRDDRSNTSKDKSQDESGIQKQNGDRSRENKQLLPQVASADVFSNESSSNVVLIKDLLYPPNRFNRPKQLVIILRGLPGSGKSYIAKLIKDKELEHGGCAPRILSLDDYFMAEVEVTDTDPETGKKIKKKEFQYEYEQCMEESYRASLLRSFKKTIDERFFPFILVDAVNNESKHYEPMWSYAKQRGFQVYIAEMESNDASVCHKRNVHKRTLEDIQKIRSKWESKPKHFLSLDVRTLLQELAIPDVEMEDSVAAEENVDDAEKEEDSNEATMPFHVPSRWEKLEATEERLDQLDGLRISKKKHSTMEDYLQLPDDYDDRKYEPGKKRVRWADLEERKEQDRLRAIGFVVGQTDWSKLTDPSHADRALTRTKYI